MKSIKIFLTTVLIILQICCTLNAQPVAFTQAVASLEYVEPVIPEPIDLEQVFMQTMDELRKGWGLVYPTE